MPSARLSAIEDTMPVMCEVYCCTARKPPALAAPAMNARHRPSWRLLCLERRRSVRRRAYLIGMAPGIPSVRAAG
ncbi:hypothetical protein D3C86_2070860 [compost metagenome]